MDRDVSGDLFENAPFGYLVTTADGVVTLVNDTYLSMTGHRREAVIGETFKSLLSVGSRLFHETRHLPVLRLEGRADEVALSLTCADGTSGPTLVNSVIATGPDGRQEIRIAVFDSTRRRDYERELLASRRAAESSEARVRVLQQASSDFAAAATEQGLADALAGTVRSAVDATAAAVFRIDSRGELVLAAGTNPLQDLLPADALRPESEAVRRGQIVTVSDTTEPADHDFPDLAPSLRSARLETVTAVPVFDNGSLLGVILYSFARHRAFDDNAVELTNALTRQAAQVLARIRLQDQLTHLALHDQLTGLSNRKLLQERLSQSLATSRRTGRPVSVLFLDLDGFKTINDTNGHSAGDAVLQRIAERLRTSVRQEDTIGRYGGDEFVVLCDDADEAAATVVAERIQKAVSVPVPDADGHPLTASIGIAVIGPNARTGASANLILRTADAAMYTSKNAGKNRITVVHV